MKNIALLKHATMRHTTIIGVVLIIFGLLSFAIGGITFFTHLQDVSLGPIDIDAIRNQPVPIAPILSTIVLGVGVAFVLTGPRSPRSKA